jgi:hypothetical protein
MWSDLVIHVRSLEMNQRRKLARFSSFLAICSWMVHSVFCAVAKIIESERGNFTTVAAIASE